MEEADTKTAIWMEYISEYIFGINWSNLLPAVFIMAGVIILWIGVLIKLWRMTIEQRDTRKSALRTVTKPYKLKYWYWEIVLVSRRIFLAFMVTFQVQNACFSISKHTNF